MSVNLELKYQTNGLIETLEPTRTIFFYKLDSNFDTSNQISNVTRLKLIEIYMFQQFAPLPL